MFEKGREKNEQVEWIKSPISAIFYLYEEEGLEQKIEEHICNDLADAGKRLSFTSRHFKRQISNVLPNKT